MITASISAVLLLIGAIIAYLTWIAELNDPQSQLRRSFKVPPTYNSYERCRERSEENCCQEDIDPHLRDLEL